MLTIEAGRGRKCSSAFDSDDAIQLSLFRAAGDTRQEMAMQNSEQFALARPTVENPARVFLSVSQRRNEAALERHQRIFLHNGELI
jgi:hypothetical protein